LIEQEIEDRRLFSRTGTVPNGAEYYYKFISRGRHKNRLGIRTGSAYASLRGTAST
jgi:hypothetical protein